MGDAGFIPSTVVPDVVDGIEKAISYHEKPRAQLRDTGRKSHVALKRGPLL